MRLPHDEATASLLGLLMGTAIFALSFASLLQNAGPVDRAHDLAETSSLAAAAAELSELFLHQPGQGWYATPCVGVDHRPALQAEGLVRFGLAAEGCEVAASPSSRDRLSYEKLVNLEGAALAATQENGHVDYQDARRSLALDAAGLNFHLRAWPLLPALDEILTNGHRNPSLRALYVADYEETPNDAPASYQVRHQASAIEDAASVRLHVTITNNGTTPTAFTVTFQIPTRHEIVHEAHTPILSPSQSATVTFVLNKTRDWQPQLQPSPDVTFSVRDPSKTVGTGTVEFSTIAMAHAETRRIYLVESARPAWRLDHRGRAAVAIDYDALDGSGSTNVDGSFARLDIRDDTDRVVASVSSLRPRGGTQTFDLDRPGFYRAQLWAGNGWLAQEDGFLVTDSDIQRFTPGPIPGTWKPTRAAILEAGYLQTLLEHFDAAAASPTYDDSALPYLPSGDVFPDDNRWLGENLAPVLQDASNQPSLANYNLLVVGSGVDHRTLPSGSVKLPIRDWVLAGGILIVFGSTNQTVQWLEPLFHAGLETANGGLAIPDPNHPILRTPNLLDVPSLDDHGMAWRFHRDQDGRLFTHAVVSGDGDALALSNAGAFGLGRVVLTSWQPYDLTREPSPACEPITAACPGIQLVDNLLTVVYHGLHLDYGPPLPDHMANGAQTRIGLVYHPELRDWVELAIVTYVFH